MGVHFSQFLWPERRIFSQSFRYCATKTLKEYSFMIKVFLAVALKAKAPGGPELGHGTEPKAKLLGLASSGPRTREELSSFSCTHILFALHCEIICIISCACSVFFQVSTSHTDPSLCLDPALAPRPGPCRLLCLLPTRYSSLFSVSFKFHQSFHRSLGSTCFLGLE